jgi:hypothetical protein
VSGSNATVGGTLTVTGNAAIGTSAGADIGLRVQPTLSTGTNQYGFYSYPTVNAATVDGGFFGVRAAASSSVGSAFSLRAYSPTLDTGAAIATVFGLKIENQGVTGVTNAFGIDISAQSGASSSNVGLRNAGTTLLTNTTASTTTSSGALVVGNGTSGGLGVGGAGYFGGLLNISSTAGLYAQWKKTDNASGSQSWAWIANNDGTLFLQAANDNFVGANSYLSFARSGVTPGTTTIHGTTASTSISSGALVVSGGVGVAGAIYAGAAVSSIQSSNSILAGASLENGSTGNAAAVRLSMTAGTRTGEINTYGSGHATLAGRIRVATSNGQIDFIPSGVFALGIDANDVAIQSGIGLKLGNAYVAGAPTATGYIVIKDSTGTSYKIPAVAL